MKFKLLVLMALIVPAALAGPVTSGGGDAVKLDFMVAADSALLSIQRVGSRLTPAVDAAKFKAAIDADHVEITDSELTDRGQRVGAYYDGDKDVIYVNRTAWERIEDRQQKMRLAAHEILRRMGADDDQYQISKKLDQIEAIRFSLEYSVVSEFVTYVEIKRNFAIPVDSCFVNYKSGRCTGQWEQHNQVAGHDFFVAINADKYWDENTPAHYHVTAFAGDRSVELLLHGQQEVTSGMEFQDVVSPTPGSSPAYLVSVKVLPWNYSLP